MDAKCPVEISSEHTNKILVTIAEALTRFTALHPIWSKFDTATEVLRFIREYEKQSAHSVFKVYND